MREHPLSADLFEGHASLEHGPGWVKPWRLPHDQKGLFPSPGYGLLVRAQAASGVRLRFATEATSLQLRTMPLQGGGPGGGRSDFFFDLTIDGAMVASCPVPPDGDCAPSLRSIDAWSIWVMSDYTTSMGWRSSTWP